MKATRIAGAVALAMMASASHAATYYVNAGSTATAPDGSAAKPWKTLASVNAAPLQPQDVVLLQCGSVWEETLVLKARVTYKSSTDNCANKPVIRGSASVGGLTWTHSGGTAPVYWADVTSLGTNPITQVFANGQRLQRARHPNVVRNGAGAITSRYDRMAATVSGATNVPNFRSDAFTPAQEQAIATEGWAGAKLYTNFEGYAVMRHTAIPSGTGTVTWTVDPESPTFYAAGAPIGRANTAYWLENKRWMLDEPGEWFHDTAQKRLYVYMPNGLSPQGNASVRAAIRPHGIKAELIGGFTVSNVEVRETAHDAVYLDRPNTSGAVASFSLNKLTVAFAGNRGVYVLGGTSGSVSYSTVTDTMAIPISIGDVLQQGLTTGDGITVNNNVVTRAGDQFFAVAGIKGSRAAMVAGNEVSEMPGMGIIADRDSWVSGNKISQVCKAATDCGAIYMVGEDLTDLATQPLNITVTTNQIDGVLSASDGLIQGEAGLGGRGIYADDFATAVTITNNHVTNAGVGVLLHYTQNVAVTNNLLVGNRITQIKFLEADPSDRNLVNFCARPYSVSDSRCGAGDFVMDNTVTGNTMVATQATAGLVQEETAFASTTDFATYDNNVYVGASPSPFMTFVRGEAGWSAMAFNRWKNGLNKDTGSQYHANLALAVASSVQPLTVPGFHEYGWWRSGSPDPVTSLSPDNQRGPAMRVDATGSTGANFFLNIPSISVERGSTYALRFDARSVSTPAGRINAVLESVVSPPGVNAMYEPLADQAQVQLGQTWQTFETPLSAWKTASDGYRDPHASLGRLDFRNLSGKTIDFANLKLVKSVRAVADQSVIVYNNRTGASQTYPCPHSSRCTQYVDAKTGAPVAYPLTLTHSEKKTVVWSQRPGRDSDGDGVEDDREPLACRTTAWDQSVNEVGCVAVSAP